MNNKTGRQWFKHPIVSAALITLLATILSSRFSVAEDAIKVYKSPTCGCCSAWIEHLEQKGFRIDAHDVESVNPYKQALGVPYGMGSCHTATIDGYFIEGHVPAEDIKRLLKERPEIIGLTVPGMPIGSPGMEMPNRAPDPFNVYAIDRAGNKTVFASH